MKSLIIIILCFLFVPITFAQLKPVPFKKDLLQHEQFKLDSNLVKMPQLGTEWNWQTEYLNKSNMQVNKVMPHKGLETLKLNQEVLACNIEQMPVMAPNYNGSMPIYVPDESIHYHVQVLMIEPISGSEARPVE